MSSEESDGSDIQIHSALSKMPKKKLPNSPSDDLLQKKQDKKLSTKIMIQQALIDLKSRKGVSLYAIKKNMAEKYKVNTQKLNPHIKKYIKSAVEEGIIIQTKGTGATGSYKLAPIKENKPKPKKPKKETTKEEKTEKMKDPENLKKTEGKSLKSKVKSKESKEDKPVKPKKKVDENKNGGEKMKKVKITKDMQSPSKKKMIRKKSIGSVKKPPKMKPRAQA